MKFIVIRFTPFKSYQIIANCHIYKSIVRKICQLISFLKELTPLFAYVYEQFTKFATNLSELI